MNIRFLSASYHFISKLYNLKCFKQHLYYWEYSSFIIIIYFSGFVYPSIFLNKSLSKCLDIYNRWNHRKRITQQQIYMRFVYYFEKEIREQYTFGEKIKGHPPSPRIILREIWYFISRIFLCDTHVSFLFHYNRFQQKEDFLHNESKNQNIVFP